MRKDQLDQELDVMQKRQALPAVVHGPYSRGRGWAGGRGGWNPRGRGRGGVLGAQGRMTLDNRPKTLEVKGFELGELEEVKAHFQVIHRICLSFFKNYHFR